MAEKSNRAGLRTVAKEKTKADDYPPTKQIDGTSDSRLAKRVYE